MPTSKTAALGLAGLALCLQACASAGPPVPSSVSLRDGVWFIPSEGVWVNQREGLYLDPGTHRFATELAGHRTRIHDVELPDREPTFVQVDPGQGYAVVEVTLVPAPSSGALVNLDTSDRTALDGILRAGVELDAGRYRIDARARGHRPLTHEFEVAAGRPVALALSFEPNPTRAPLRITTSPPGATVMLDGREVGEAPVYLESVDFGARRVAAYMYEDADNRLAVVEVFQFREGSSPARHLELTERQRRFGGDWHALSEALELEREEMMRLRREEELAYRRVRVSNPIEVRVDVQRLGGAALPDREAATPEDFTRALFMALRPGDRVSVDVNGGRHVVWKRSIGRQPAFDLQARALWDGSAPVPGDHDDDAARVIEAELDSTLLATVAYRLHRALNASPVLDLAAPMHDLDAISVHAIAADGGLTVVAVGGTDLTVNGEEVDMAGPVGVVRLPSADRELRLAWSEAPVRALVVSAADRVIEPDAPDAPLNLHGKMVVGLGLEDRVQSFHRFTRHPDNTWERAFVERRGPLAETLNLQVDGIGPHTACGSHERQWLVHYQAAGERLATRQITVNYEVGTEAEMFQGSDFLRREAVIRPAGATPVGEESEEDPC